MTQKNAFPAEWMPHEAVWSAWPSHKSLWREDLTPARAQVAALFRAIDDNGAGEQVMLLAHGQEAVDSARVALRGTRATVVDCAFGDIWLRDTGPLFTSRKTALRFRNNGWGGKYSLPHDDTVGDAVADHAGAEVARYDFILEGGAIDVDGAGRLITTEQCLLNPNRNPDMTRDTLEAILGPALGIDQFIWLGEGLVGDHTDGHVDNLARFVGSGHVLLPEALDADDPNTAILEDAAARVEAAGLTLSRIPSPGRVIGPDGDVVPASYMNFYIGNTTVVVPVYGTRWDERAVEAIAAHFPTRKTIGLPANAVLTGGGAFHCITQQVPAG